MSVDWKWISYGLKEQLKWCYCWTFQKLFDVVLCTTVVLITFCQQNIIYGGWGRGKIIPTISTVSLFNPTVRIPRLQCIQFVRSLKVNYFNFDVSVNFIYLFQLIDHNNSYCFLVFLKNFWNKLQSQLPYILTYKSIHV
jgi:hypothetical protein